MAIDNADVTLRLHNILPVCFCGIVLAFFTACDSKDPEAEFELSPVARATDLPDIVLISIDSLRYDHLGSYGYPRPTSPAIDRIAAAGARFENAVSTTSWTLPAHAAMFTGLYDSTHGVFDNGHRLSDRFVTLAEVLHDTGYTTAGFYGGPYLHPTFGLDQGFDTYTSCMTRIPEDVSGEEIRASAKSLGNTAHADVTGPRTRDAVATWLKTIDGRPFFLFLHMWDVHYDYIPPERYVSLFDPDYDGDLVSHNFPTNRRIHAGMPARDLQHLLALYDGEIRFTDDILGQIFGMLEQTGRFSDALIVITADHGEEFFEHGRKGHNETLFDEVIRVPLIFRWPGNIPGGRVVQDQVRLIDLMPTLLALAGADEPTQGQQGRDVSPLMHSEPLISEPAIAELQLGNHDIRALRTNSEKLISYADRDFRYYDLHADSLEQHPLPHDQERFGRAQRALRGITESAQRLGKQLTRDDESGVSLDSAMCRRLRALGYLDSGANCETGTK
jgi:arylsulfatase A-like enzyme